MESPQQSHRHPVTSLYNNQTHMTCVTAVGEISYADLVEQTTRFAKGEVIDNEDGEGGTRV